MIDKPLKFTCVDFEKEAFGFIKGKLEEIDDQKKRFLKIDYLPLDIRDIAKGLCITNLLVQSHLNSGINRFLSQTVGLFFNSRPH
ncbi:hypothetical protein A3H38_00660 [candidate division WOR-1 bacterium RIFCSPLOWO2_02_FULL_46_20]|uniref:Uncharacterized protein n=2 Tax=Saganbacteria TaxID=1703751 RepID=A0A1F4R724_UNCSA|nr:MAG: hypothetical protein A3J44_04755 [candidate division WOR-1 bacterium RIFCSPHIGHO2_02_FULL_45_12]OGC03243.1 MAG: hypothetical protein A3H38_00660 [candidate division WOR-1 bacterium RIFCSPLOWO2_02_FULL_46_20]OGC09447.1 MAG: hypothetical protein A3F86_01355 [candidate division WOR-1 bacterium RIFCSPLOWO2_12_FULL_45_9]